MPTGDMPEVAYKGLPYGQNQQANAQTPAVSGLEEGAQKFIFDTPTARPDEPVTTGQPFGPGASYVQLAHETATTYRERVANSLLSSPSSDPDVKRFAEKILRGE